MSANLLLPHHLRQLRDSGISDEVIDGRGYQTVGRPTAGDGRPRDLLRRCGMPSWITADDARFPGLLVPIFRVTGELITWQYRPDVPGRDRTGRLRRYVMPAGRPPSLDLHPCNRNRITDPAVPLLVTEGVKKADALTTAGACVVALSGVFNWRSRLGTLGDWEDIVLRGREVAVVFDADARANVAVARAMDRLGRWLKSKGVAKVGYVVVPAAINGTKTKGADDYFAAGGTLQTLLSAAESRPPEIAGDDGLTDSEVAQSFAESIEGRFCWGAGLGWMKWDGRRWAGTSLPAVREQARQWLDAQHAAALEEAAAIARRGGDESRATATAKDWRAYRSAAKIGAVVTLATGVEWVMKDAADFDSHPDLINAANGVIDLATSELRPHNPALLLTRITTARYVRGAWHGDWYRALGAVPPDCRPWIRLRLGQAVTGYPPPDDAIVFGTGHGENGKTTLFYGMCGALGDYAVVLSQRVLSPEHNREHPAELMDLRGARIAVVEELPEGKHLSVQRIKDLTQPQIKARGMRENWLTWDSTHCLFVNSNYKPLVRETDHGTWRRLPRMHWPFRFWKAHEWDALVKPGPQDRRAIPGLRERIRAGDDGRREAVLAWVVEGARRWYAGDREHGREPMTMGIPPARIVADTEDWQATANPMIAFCREWLTKDPGMHVRTEDFAARFEAYLDGQGHSRWSRSVINTRFEDYWEHRGVHVTRKYTKLASGNLSRGSFTDPPQGYQAWHGVRWCSADKPSDEGKQQPVSEVSEQSINPPKDPASRGHSTGLKPLKPGPPAPRNVICWEDLRRLADGDGGNRK